VFLRENDPFDYVIDAANVAYQKQNYYEGRFKYEQVRVGRKPFTIIFDVFAAMCPTASFCIFYYVPIFIFY